MLLFGDGRGRRFWASADIELPDAEIQSADLRVSAFNADSAYRRTVYLDIDGVGGDIAYGMAETIGDGFIRPGKSRTWTFDLGETCRMLVKHSQRYDVVTDSDRETQVNYLKMLRSHGKHTLNCCVSVSDRYAGASRISLDLIVKYGRPEKTKQPLSPSISTDAPNDPRIRLAVERLKDRTSTTLGKAGSLLSGYRFVIGKNIAKPFLRHRDLAGLSNEGFVIKSLHRGGVRYLVVSGCDYQGIAYGVFRLTRIIASEPKKLSSLYLKLNPAVATREMYEEHDWSTPGRLSQYKFLLNRYLEEGINTFDLPVGWFLVPPQYLKDPVGHRKEDFSVVHEVIRYAHSLGIRVYLIEDAFLNPLCQEVKENLRNIPGDTSKFASLTAGGAYEPVLLCLQKQLSRNILVSSREILCKEFTDADGIVIGWSDPGGCCHPECRPHGKMVVDLMNSLYAPLFRKTNPGMKVTLSLWGMELADVEYVLAHERELPSNVVGLQIPPTNMNAGQYLLFESARGNLIKNSAANMPIIVQQFYEGVGFRDSWVNAWEHPMPREMTDNFRGCTGTGVKVGGVYRSAFDLGSQLIDTRIGMEWGWFPDKDAGQTLVEFGDDEFGTGVGKDFRDAMYNMDDYWYYEAWRFHFDGSRLSSHVRADIKRSLSRAQLALDSLLNAENLVYRNHVYYKGFEELAQMMVLAARTILESDEAKSLAEVGQTTNAVELATSALENSERMVEIISQSDRYARLIDNPWWKAWDIGKRPVRLKRLVSETEHPVHVDRLPEAL